MEPSEVDSPLSVLLVHVWYWPHLGGGNQHVEHIARQLVARGHKATVWCADIPEHEEKRFIRDGVEVIRLSPKRILGGIDPVVSIQQLEMNFDIVHLHDTLPVLIRRSIKRARKEKIPVVTTFHNDYIKTSLSGKILKRIRWALQGRRTLHSSNARIALTPYYANHLKNRGVDKSIDVLPNGFEPVAEDAARPASLPVSFEEHPLFVFVGRLSEQKGLDVLMDAWDMLCHQGEPNACLAIAGSGELDAWLDKRIASSKYPDSIAKLGFAGAPWTICMYLLAGGTGDKDFHNARAHVFSNREQAEKMFISMGEIVGDLLADQVIHGGADAVQIFDTWAGLLSPEMYQKFAMPATQHAISVFKQKVGDSTPLIHYAKGSGHLHHLIRELDLNAISLDWRDDLSTNRAQFGNEFAFQGNLDPSLLHGSVEAAQQATYKVLEAAGNQPGHIFNLGHGFAPSARIECVEAVLKILAGG